MQENNRFGILIKKATMCFTHFFFFGKTVHLEINGVNIKKDFGNYQLIFVCCIIVPILVLKII